MARVFALLHGMLVWPRRGICGLMWASVPHMTPQGTHPATRQRVFDRVRMREAREDAGFTVETLSEATGISMGGIHKLEQGSRRRPRPTTYRRIIRCLRLSEGALWIYPNAKPTENTGGGE